MNDKMVKTVNPTNAIVSFPTVTRKPEIGECGIEYNCNIVRNHIRDSNILLDGGRNEVHIVEIIKHPRISGNSQRPGWEY
jgi:hypothetical protein